MNKIDRTQIAEETIQITKQGYYINSRGEQIDLIAGNQKVLYAVDVYSPERSNEILSRADELKKTKAADKECSFYLVDADSLKAAEKLNKPLVMNFASAHHPGGGFLKGASAQEECLCRQSTLYVSISSSKAREMYDYNHKLNSAVDSDYFLISPNVIVFRNSNLSLRGKPFKVSVVTIAAPNKSRRAADVEQSALDKIMTDRLRKMLYAAAEKGYKNLVLGAWGCGAFGNDPDDVAGYFYKLFFDEEINVFFDKVVFAVLGGGKNYSAFKNVFGNKIKEKETPEF